MNGNWYKGGKGGKNEVLNELRDHGYSLWRVAKEVGVAYHTVLMWDKGVFSPGLGKGKNAEKLEGLRRKKP